MRSDACMGVSVTFSLRGSNDSECRSRDSSTPRRCDRPRRIWPPVNRTESAREDYASVGLASFRSTNGPMIAAPQRVDVRR